MITVFQLNENLTLANKIGTRRSQNRISSYFIHTLYVYSKLHLSRSWAVHVFFSHFILLLAHMKTRCTWWGYKMRTHNFRCYNIIFSSSSYM